MIKKCENCSYLTSKEEARFHYTEKIYSCKLHKVKVSYPDSQFCGDEYWVSIKSTERLNKLKQLGI